MSAILARMPKKTLVLAALLLVGGALALSVVREANKSGRIEEFKARMRAEPVFIERIALYREFMAAAGAEEGQRVLASFMSNDSVTHMLNHESGRFLYETEGFAGVKKCTTVFADSCYHGFISAVILDVGLTDLEKLLGACMEGTVRDQQLQCAHGLGHGFLENVGYEEMPRALDLCLQTFGNDQRAAEHCYEGVFMENNFGLFGVAPEGRFVDKDDPMYPCNEPFVRAKPGAHEYCWFMNSQATMRGIQYHALGTIEKVSAYCKTLAEGFDEDVCFMGLARQIQLLNSNNKVAIEKECARLPAERVRSCVWNAAQAAYIYGERTPDVFRMCDAEPDGDRAACYETLFVAIGVSYSADEDRLRACDMISSEAWRDACRAWVDSPKGQRI